MYKAGFSAKTAAGARQPRRQRDGKRVAPPDKEAHCTPEKGRVCHCGDGDAFFIHSDATGPGTGPPREPGEGFACGGTQEAGRVRRDHGRRKAALQDARSFNDETFIPYARPLCAASKGRRCYWTGVIAPLKAGKECIWQKQGRRVHLPAQGFAVSQCL